MMVAAEYEDFGEAIRRKLPRELVPVPTAPRGGPSLAAR